jgi:hypothetical protein
VVKLLIEHHAEVNANDSNALQWVCEKGHIDVAKLLIEHNADVNARDNHAVRAAAGHGHLDLVKLLVEYGADISDENDNAFVWAAQEGHYEVVKLLIDLGADAATHGTNVIKQAAEKGSLRLVKLLVIHGADFAAAELGLSYDWVVDTIIKRQVCISEPESKPDISGSESKPDVHEGSDAEDAKIPTKPKSEAKAPGTCMLPGTLFVYVFVSPHTYIAQVVSVKLPRPAGFQVVSVKLPRPAGFQVYFLFMFLSCNIAQVVDFDEHSVAENEEAQTQNQN